MSTEIEAASGAVLGRRGLGSASVVAAILLLLSLMFVLPAPVRAAAPPELRQVIDLLEAGDFSAARRELASVGSEGFGGWIDCLEGRLLLAEGDASASVESLRRAVQTSPDTAPFRRWLGEAYIARIDTVSVFSKPRFAKKALAELREAARLDPLDFDTRETLVRYYLEAPGIVGGGDDKALAEANDFARLAAAAGHLLMAQIKTHHQDHEGAIAEYRAGMSSRPDDADLRYGLGMALQGLGRFTEAFLAFEKAIELDPDYMDPYYQLGRTAIFSDTNLERAIECMQVYLDHEVPPGSPGHEHAHWRLGMIYQLQGDVGSARREFEAAVKLDPDHDEAKKALKTLGRS